MAEIESRLQGTSLSDLSDHTVGLIPPPPAPPMPVPVAPPPPPGPPPMPNLFSGATHYPFFIICSLLLNEDDRIGIKKYVDLSFSGTTSIAGVAGDNINGQFGSALPTSAVRKNVPKSANPLKSFNWSKLPDCKVRYLIYEFYQFSIHQIE